MARTENDLRNQLKAALGGPVADLIIERREQAEETVANGKETGALPKDDGNLARMFADMFAGMGRKHFSGDGELIENEPGTVRSPGGTKNGRIVAMTVRALASTGKCSPDEVQEKAIEYLETRWKGNPDADVVIKSLDQPDRIKTLNTTANTSGGLFVLDTVAQSVIELLRPQSVVASLGAREVPLPAGSLILPTHKAGATGTWLGEDEEIVSSEPSLGAREMKEKTYASLVLVTQKLLRSSSLAVDQFVADDLRLDAGVAQDVASLRGNAAARPKGIRYLGQATATAGTTLAQVNTDLVGCLERMGDAGLPMSRIGWGMSWRSWRHLFNLTFAADQKYAFRDELITGNLLGFPFRRSSNIPKNLGGGSNESELYCMELDNLIIGRGEAIAFDMSTEASVNVSGSAQHAFQRALMIIRMMVGMDIQVRHPEAVQIITGLTWGV